MRTKGEAQEIGGQGRMQRMLSLSPTAAGAVLLAYMVTVESEPGAIPLLLIVGGTAWLLVTRIRSGRS